MLSLRCILDSLSKANKQGMILWKRQLVYQEHSNNLLEITFALIKN